MGLERVGMRIWEQGYSGLKFVNLIEKLSYFELVRKYLLIHCGTFKNDIGVIDLPLRKLITIVSNHVQLVN